MQLRLKQYFANVLLLLIALYIYSNNKYYVSLLSLYSLIVLKVYVYGYIAVGFIFYVFILKEIHQYSKGYIFIISIKNRLKDLASYLHEFPYSTESRIQKWTPEEKTAVLFVLVKLFYVPLMVDFWVKNSKDVYHFLSKLPLYIDFSTFSFERFNMFWYPFAISVIFTIDTFIFMSCYLFEADFLRNKVKSVEPTAFGWIVTLLCYPPFNAFGGNYLSWPATNYPNVENHYLTFLLRLLILLLFCFYLWATLSLSTKASNLTNRGIVTKGAYSIVRHPSYIAKNLAWWISIIPVLSIGNVLSMICWTSLYFLRAITEERHLIKDPEYQLYSKKVKYRFIPYLW